MSKTDIAKYLINNHIDKMTSYLIEDYGLDLPSALQVVYTSQLLVKLQDTDNELYIQSPSYIYTLLQSEYTTGKLI